MSKCYPRYLLPPIPFAQRPRRYKRDAYIRAKNHIRRAAPVLGGTFYAPHCSCNSDAHLGILLLGRKAPVFYDAELRTTRCAYLEKVHELVWDKSYELVPDNLDISNMFVKAPDSDYYTLVRDERRYPEFGGLTRDEWIDEQTRIVADSGEVQVVEEWTLERGYASGIGLFATLDVPRFDVDNVRAFVARFLETESNYHGTQGRSWRADDIVHFDGCN